ncbi:MAG: choice-of-anchor Q domain-containing protein [Chloroflexota bacterium]
MSPTGSDAGNDCSVEAMPCATVQRGLDEAASGGTVFLAAGMYVENLVISKDVVLQGADSVIDGNLAGRVVAVESGLTAVLRDVAVINGRSTHGAGIYNNGSTLTLERVIVSNNQTDDGANGTLETLGGQGGNGAGIYSEGGSLTIRDSAIDNNQTGSGGTGQGSNSGGDGGGIFIQNGILTVESSTISNNQTGDGGSGGTGNFGQFGGFGGFAGDGAGIYALNSTMTLTNSTVSGNQTGNGNSGSFSRGGGRGAGIFFEGQTAVLTLTHVTLTNNQTRAGGAGLGAGNGGGLYAAGPTNVENSLIAGNVRNGVSHGTTSDCGHNPVSQLGSGDGNLVGDGTGCPSNQANDQVVDSGMVETAVLHPLTDNGGQTQTHALRSGNPAIDAAASTPCVNSDQRGVPRPQESGCDVGAFEFALPIAPTVAAAQGSTYEQLVWFHAPPNLEYEVWRHTSPYFAAGSEGSLVVTLTAVSGTNSWEPTSGGLDDANINYFYQVRGKIGSEVSAVETAVGEFTFALVAGSP